ncbi:hypothetical protein [Manganibacter manganicus]|uniref:Uncharacterized protein n=1 Tax=Manganibacter manganicus TaxID=1873176 RepID=A0A1V8RQ83_9HYPH|nr:hypothetical protein [Pseudaminobacter manganicus]OQM75293.1 hypothetical protein BFN67_19270 [Pseudaminobacter manganicus]
MPRDDFTAATKRYLALRASHHCSLCKVSTVGPSDEKPTAVTMIGKAAHICAASPGPGARRYDPTTTSAQRSDISNGIWLCANCADLIDKDEVRFTADWLRRAKAEHEKSRKIGNVSGQGDGDIIAIGPSIVAVGSVQRTSPAGTRVQLAHFVEGNGRELFSFAEGFDRLPERDRYILLSELGFGNLLLRAPTIERTNGVYEVEFALQEHLTRISATSGICGMCIETGRMISGMEVLVQNFERTLGMARGTWFANLEGGSDLSDLYWRYKNSPWFARLAMKEMIRLSCLPTFRRDAKEIATPLACVNRVDRVEVPTFKLVDQHLSLTVEFDIEGLGPWVGGLSVFVSMPEQLEESRATAKLHADRIAQIEMTSTAR